MRKLAILVYLFSSMKIAAQEKTFEREYTYKASEMDSKLSCRAITVNQLRSALLNEVGVYVKSEQLLKTIEISGKFSQDFVENIATISAGVTKLEILDERWNGEVFWMRAAITINKESLEESLKQLINDKQRVKELEELKQQLTQASNELDLLKKERMTENTKVESSHEKSNSQSSIQPTLEEPISKKLYKILIEDGYNLPTSYETFILDLENPKNLKVFHENIVKEGYNIPIYEEFAEAMFGKGRTSNEKYNDDIKTLILADFVLDGNKKHEDSDYSGAIEEFTKVIELSPNDGYGYKARGLSKLEKHDFRGAFEDFTSAIEFSPEDEDAYFYRGRWKSMFFNKDLSHDYIGAISDLTKAIELDPDFAEAYLERGKVKRFLDNNDGAIVDLTRAILLDPKLNQAFHTRGVIKAQAFSDYQGAIADLNEAIKLFPWYESYSARGFSKQSLMDYRGAIADYTNAIEKGGGIIDETYVARARAKVELKNYTGAVSDCTKQIEFLPKSAESYFVRGYSKILLGQKSSGCLDLSKAGELGYTEAYGAIKALCQ